MTDESPAYVYKMKIQWLDTPITKFFCSHCKMELTDPNDHTKFRTLTRWRGGWREQQCPYCYARLKEVVTPITESVIPTQSLDSF